MLVPSDARIGYEIPWTGVLGICGPHDLGAKNLHFVIMIFKIVVMYPPFQGTNFIFFSDLCLGMRRHF